MGSDDVAFHKAVFELDRMSPSSVGHVLWSLVGTREDVATRRVTEWVKDLLGAAQRGRYFHERGDAAEAYARDLSCPEPTLEMLRTVNEHWNGAGFPGRKRRTEIPVGARIVGVAQAATIWAESMPLRAVAERLGRCRGDRFEPEIVNCAVVELSLESDDHHGWLDRLVGCCGTHRAPLATLPISVPDVARTFAQIVDSKTTFTAAHCERVALLAAAMAKVGDGPVEAIALAGLLHDVGKLAVPNNILEKSGPLTDDEWARIRRHPADSSAVIGSVDGWSDLAEVAASHHERPDGTGYHAGLVGAQIPRFGAWLAAADAFDAMTADRPYRAGLDTEVAVAELRRGIGGQFTAEAVELLAAVVEQEPHLQQDGRAA